MQAAYGCVQADYACAQYFPQQAEEEPLIVELVVPDDAPPGTKLEYIAPDGQELRLTVPDGVPPGSIMTLTQDPATGAWRCMAEPGDRQEMPYGSPPATAPVPEAPRVVTEQPAAYVSATAPSAAAVAGTTTRYVSRGGPGSSTSSAARPAAGPRVATTVTYAAPQVIRPSYTPPPAVVTGGPSYTPPVAVQASSVMRSPSYVPPPAVQPAVIQHSYTPPPVMEQRPSYVPPGAVYVHENRPSYTPPPVGVMEQRPSYTPLPQVLPGGATYPMGRAVQPGLDPHTMAATTVAIQPQHIVQQMGLNQASSYVPPPVQQPLGPNRPSYVPPPVGPSITTLPTQDNMPAPPNFQMGMPPSGHLPGSSPGMGMPQMAPPMGPGMAHPQMGLPPPMGLQGLQFMQPQFGLPPMGLLGAPAPMGQGPASWGGGQNMNFPPGGQSMSFPPGGHSMNFPPGGGSQSMSFPPGGNNGMMPPPFMQPDQANGFGVAGGAIGGTGPAFGGMPQLPYGQTMPGNVGQHGGHPGMSTPMNQPPLMACG